MRSKEFFVSPSARNAEDERREEEKKKKKREKERERERERERTRKKKDEARGASVRQLNFSSFGTQLETPTAAIAPPGPGAATECDGPFPRPPSLIPIAPPVYQEGPTAIDPDLHAPNERDCQRKPTCRTRTCGNAVLRCPSRFPWSPV